MLKGRKCFVMRSLQKASGSHRLEQQSTSRLIFSRAFSAIPARKVARMEMHWPLQGRSPV
jgi:hypothetical protein